MKFDKTVLEVALKYRNKSISGIKLSLMARKAEKEKTGKGAKLLKSCIPEIKPITCQKILNRTHLLLGVNIFKVLKDPKAKEKKT